MKLAWLGQVAWKISPTAKRLRIDSQLRTHPSPICDQDSKAPEASGAQNSEVPVSQSLYKAFGTQDISALAVGSRHSPVATQRASALALQITSSDRFNILYCLRRQAACHASQPAAKECQVVR
jgi:hypothetical protein